MKTRIAKAFLLIVRSACLRLSNYSRLALHLYYMVDQKLFTMARIVVMPMVYYKIVVTACTWLSGYKTFHKISNLAIHTIPLHIRFKVA